MSDNRKTIFLVDDDITNLTVGKNTLSEYYDVFTMNSAARLLKMLEKSIPDLILLDVNMPEMNGYEAIEIIKSKNETKSIPVIFLTAKIDSDSELKGLSLGAIDYITKPFNYKLLLKRIEVHLLVEKQKTELIDFNNNLQKMVKAKTQSILELQNTILRTMAELVEYRDNITGEHIGRTHKYLAILFGELIKRGMYAEEIASWDMALVLESSQLHDVGKIVIKDNILLKPGKLSDEEFEEIKLHTIYGEQIIDKMKKSTKEWNFLEHARIFAGTHHEKWDGSGYPRGLKGEEIPLQGRLMAIADVYDALISERPYKKAFTHKEAVDIISKNRGTHFDPTLIDVFLSVSDIFDKIKTSLETTPK